MTPASWGIRLLCLGEAVPSSTWAEMHESCRPLGARALGKTSRIDFLICSLSEFCLGTGLVLGAVSHLCYVSTSCHIHYPSVTPKLGQQASRRWEREEQEQSPLSPEAPGERWCLGGCAPHLMHTHQLPPQPALSLHPLPAPLPSRGPRPPQDPLGQWQIMLLPLSLATVRPALTSCSNAVPTCSCRLQGECGFRDH